jgi:hypothetical protein
VKRLRVIEDNLIFHDEEALLGLEVGEDLLDEEGVALALVPKVLNEGLGERIV